MLPKGHLPVIAWAAHRLCLWAVPSCAVRCQAASLSHTLFERPHAFAETAHQLGYLLAAEQQQHNQHDEDNLRCSNHK